MYKWNETYDFAVKNLVKKIFWEKSGNFRYIYLNVMNI